MEGLEVPEDFPNGTLSAIVPGATPKLCVKLSDGVYRANQSEEERRERWLICEDLATQLVPVVERDARTHPQQSREETLERMHCGQGEELALDYRNRLAFTATSSAA